MCFRTKLITHLIIYAGVFHTSAYSDDANTTRRNETRRDETRRNETRHERHRYRKVNDNYYAPPRDPNVKHPGVVDQTTDFSLKDLLQSSNDTGGGSGAQGQAGRFTTPARKVTAERRTTPYRVSLEEECDYLAFYCLKAYKTGKLCGRTLYYYYKEFPNYCMLDYVNCRERYEVWQIAHMGACFDIQRITHYQHYEYNDDFFLDQVYVIQE